MTAIAAPAAARVWTCISSQSWITTWGLAASLALVATVAYTIGGRQDVSDSYRPLADAFLHGRLWVPFDESLELVSLGDGRAYAPFPPIPALPYLPMLAAGVAPDNTVLTAMVGGVGVALTYLLVMRLANRPVVAAVITIGLAGSTFGWAAATAGTWLYAQVLAFTLAVAALHLALRRRWPLAAGLLLGLAAGSRLPVGLLLPLVALPYWPGRRRFAELVVGVAAIAIPIAAYNLARFGSPFDFGYAQIESIFHEGTVVATEPWFTDGVVNISYIPRSLTAMLLNGPLIGTDFPYMTPSVSGTSIFLAAPMFVLALGAPRTRLVVVALAAALLVMIPNWMHGSWGFYQFGYRFLIDAMPALLLALALAYRDGLSRWLCATAAVGCLANIYGLIAALVLNRQLGF